MRGGRPITLHIGNLTDDNPDRFVLGLVPAEQNTDVVPIDARSPSIKNGALTEVALYMLRLLLNLIC